MQIHEARATAARWVAQHAARDPHFAGAFISGSAAWLPGDAELPATSDVDVLLVTTAPQPPPKPGKVRYGGILIEASPLPWAEVCSPEAVLSSYYLAGSFRTDTVLADPTGHLARLHTAAAGEYARRPWVRRRCRHAERRITDGLAALDEARPLPGQVMAWIFPTGVTTHVLLTAGLRNPTVRLRYAAARTLLLEYDRPDIHEELLRLLGCEHLSAERVADHLRAMAEVFDTAAALARTPFPFSSDLTPEARPIAVDGSRELIGRGLHREAVFWIAVTYARCLTVLEADAPPEVRAAHTPGFTGLLADLGIASPADLRRRAQEVRGYLPRLRETAEHILTANPAAMD
ncbi:hypothetical protein [Peterkaempfera bronchialis]|uniref:Uncharacterized protein n=1 Tax=Peterkaempfera bronchialis TaxID=2126346 RepID=A0A345T5R6_9ACTN|nr:hypothetical protein [Peterkaempfera bronchialis]AXI81321.1 hypothetical protein C7M71_010685 [Peterkaempfera bronchialis]